MPLRSVEAATRDDAIAAAREQFGPGARVVGVRRVRSGGVLGFFATERYVAEVDPEHPSRAAGRSREATRSSAVSAAEGTADARRTEVDVPRSAAADRVSEFAGLLGHDEPAAADGGPSTYSRASVARPAAPSFESGPFDAAWFESVRSSAARPEAARPEPSRPRDETGRPTSSTFDDARYEVSRQDTARPEPEPARTVFARAAARAAEQAAEQAAAKAVQQSAAASLRLRGDAVAASPAPWSFAASVPMGARAAAGDQDDHDAPEDGESMPPSPFTAALARMVSGDRDVRQAVQAALDDRAAERFAKDDEEPIRPRSAGPATPVQTGAGHQEEEPVTDPDGMSSLRNAAPAEVPTWAEPEPAVDAVSQREEAIAEVLRLALAQGHSDEALAGILRRVLAGVSPQTALTEQQPPPAEQQSPLVRALTAPAAVDPAPSSASTSAEPPVSRPTEPVTTLVPEPRGETFLPPSAAPAPEPLPAPGFETPAFEAPAFETPPYEAPAFEAPEPAAPVAVTSWYASPQPLWGQPAGDPQMWAEPHRNQHVDVTADDAPIWAEVVLHEPAPSSRAVELPAEEPAGEVLDAEEPEGAVASVEVVAAPVVQDAVVDLPQETLADASAAVEEEPLEAAPLLEIAATGLARTASDPAPMPLDATAVMPPLSLMPPLPNSGRRSGLPPVPPAARQPLRSTSAGVAADRAASSRTESATSGTAILETLATVTRLPVAPQEEIEEETAEVRPTATAPEPVEPPARRAAPPRARAALPARLHRSGDVVGRLCGLGIPAGLLDAAFAGDAAAHGTYAALTRTLGARLPLAPQAPTGAGEVLFVVGPGVETLRAARSLAASLRLDPERVLWATRGDLANLAPKAVRMTTIDAAMDRRQDAAVAGTVTIVAVDAPLRTDAYWMSQMLAVWTPEAVWAVVDATRKPEDLEPWIAGLPRLDALMVEDTDLSADPAAVLDLVAVPVALLDGAPATPHRWASLLCERLEKQG